MRTKDECGYLEQERRIRLYSVEHTSESVLPFKVEDRDGCSTCGSITQWEFRILPDGRLQTRCLSCKDTLTFGRRPL
jgi:hypothetical protein